MFHLLASLNRGFWRILAGRLAPPHFATDADKTRRAAILNLISLCFIALAFLSLVIRISSSQYSFFIIFTDFLLLSASLAAYQLLRRGHLHFSAYVLFAVGIAAVTLILANLGTVRTPSVVMYAVIVVSAGLFFDRRGILVIVTACVLSVFFLVLAERDGLIVPVQNGVSFAQGLILILLLVIVGGLVYLSVRMVRDALRRADAELAERKSAEQALLESERRFRRLVTNSQDIVYRMSLPDGNYEYISPAATNLFGYTPQEFYVSPELIRKIVHPRWHAYLEKEWQNLLCGEMPPTYEYQVVTKLQQVRWVHQRNVLIRDAQGTPIAIEGIVTDTTQQKRASEILLAREQILQASFAMDERTILQFVLDRAEALTESCIGFFHFLEADQKTLVLQNWSTRTKNEFCKAEGAGMHYPVAQAGVWANCVWEGAPVIFNDFAAVPNQKGMPPGHAQVSRMMAIPLFRGDKIVGIIGVGNAAYDYADADVEAVRQLADLSWDIVERKRTEAALLHLSTHDTLTGLYNRAFFQAELERLEHSRDFPISVIVSDLDNLKATNDMHGHAAGDELLKHAAAHLQIAVRKSDILCRVGGDEFVLLLPWTDHETAALILQRIRADLSDYNSNGPVLPLQLSLGAATAIDKDVMDAFRRADAEMYADKKTRKKRHVPKETAGAV